MLVEERRDLFAVIYEAFAGPAPYRRTTLAGLAIGGIVIVLALWSLTGAWALLLLAIYVPGAAMTGLLLQPSDIAGGWKVTLALVLPLGGTLLVWGLLRLIGAL